MYKTKRQAREIQPITTGAGLVHKVKSDKKVKVKPEKQMGSTTGATSGQRKPRIPLKLGMSRNMSVIKLRIYLQFTWQLVCLSA